LTTIRRVTLAAVATMSAVLALTSLAVARNRTSSHRPGAPGVHSRRHHPAGRGSGFSGAGRSNRFSPEVIKTGRPPTGYEVRFRYYDPAATSVQIKGEWYFSSPGQTTTTSSQGLLPFQWSPGDFPIAYPNALAANWPVSSMTKDRGGVWSYTTPLPSGVFTYGFYINCTTSDQSGCTEVSDPSNPPWNEHHGVSIGSVEPTSQVYVPSDRRFHTVNYWWQARARPRGALTDVTYPSPSHISPAGQNYLAIYTPPGYDPNRAAPYPTLYLSHGGGGNEVDWSTQGDAANILDNLIDTGQISPMVVVMTNFNGFADNCPALAWDAEYSNDLLNSVIPYVNSHYHVSGAAAQRAFSGLSCGGLLTSYLMLNFTNEFGYYGVMSGGFPDALSGGTTTLTAAQIAALKNVGIMAGGGWQDPIHSTQVAELNALQSAGIGVFPDFINGGHEWYVWRILLRDFLTRVAFFPVAG
jgi:enterochelin esterase-like enzyme